MSNQLKLEVVLSAFDRASAPLRGISKQAQNAALAFKSTQKELRLLNRAQEGLQKTRMTLQGTGRNPSAGLIAGENALTAQIARANTELTNRRRLLDRLNAQAASHQKWMQRANALQSGGTMTMAKGLAAGYVASRGVSAFASAENAGMGLKTSMMRADGSVPEEFQKINDLATQLGDKLPGTTADFQNMMNALVEQGISFKSILGGTGEATAYIAVRMGMDFKEAAEFSAKMLDATQSTEGEMMSLMDSINKGRGLGLDNNEMLQAITSMSPALATLKKKGQEATDILMPLIVMGGKNELTGGAAGTAFSKIINRSIDLKAINKAQKTLRGTGLKLDFTDKKGEFGGIENLFVQLKKLDKLNSQKRNAFLKELFGDNAEVNQALNILMNNGVEGYKKTIAEMEAQASLQQRVNAQLGTLTNLWDSAMGTMTNVVVSIVEQIAPELRALAEWIGQVSGALSIWIKANPRLAKALALLIAGAIALTIATGALSLVVGTGIKIFMGLGAVIPIVSALGTAFRVLSAIVVANPIAAAITLAIVAITMIYRNWESFVWFFKDGAGQLVEDFKAKFPGITATVTTAFNLINPIFQTFKTLVFGTIDMIVNLINLDFMGAWNSIKFMFDELNIQAKSLIDTIKGLWDTLKQNPLSEVGGNLGSWFYDLTHDTSFITAPTFPTGSQNTSGVPSVETIPPVGKFRTGGTVTQTFNVTVNGTGKDAAQIGKEVGKNVLPLTPSYTVGNNALIGDKQQ